jgi:HlyD family secretion protein
MKYFSYFLLLIPFIGASCGPKTPPYDASGYFEADEVIVSAQQTGELENFSVDEGKVLSDNEVVGQIDVTIPRLQKEQTTASIAALRKKTAEPEEQTLLVQRQLELLESKRAQQLREKTRTENLIKSDAATSKQLDDINAQIEQLDKQIGVARQEIRLNNSNISTQNRGILSERGPLEKSVELLQEQIEKGSIVNPVQGTVLARYALRGELMNPGKPLYKIASLDTLTLRAYVSGKQLARIKTGQPVQVRIEEGENGYKLYQGLISWISSTSEFTPKTIQTKDERANLVYAFKVLAKNDGYLKIGMYGEVLFNDPKNSDHK